VTLQRVAVSLFFVTASFSHEAIAKSGKFLKHTGQ
jgi:hypothetical protein